MDYLIREAKEQDYKGILQLYDEISLLHAKALPQIFIKADTPFWNKEYISGIGGYLLGTVDLLGDWREEVIVSVKNEVRIYISTITAVDKRVCLLQDNLYRNTITHASMG